jgi:predicted secreted hydrolase
MKKVFALVLIILVLAAAGFLWQRSSKSSAGGNETSLVPLLSEAGPAGFTQAVVPGDVEFPRDLGPHDDYQTEWWYYTGILETDTGRSFGFQLTFFRRALAPPADSQADCLEGGGSGDPGSSLPECPQESAWRTNQVYLAHFAISDIGADAFYPFERFSRSAVGLAGAMAQPYRVWLENWQVEQIGPGVARLVAQSDDIALDLLLTESLPPILHGDGGLSLKGPEPGNASYYYSIVQQRAEGTISLNEQLFSVSGLAWKDHEYSTSALSPGAVGWDWFSIQLDDGSALMFFQIRNEDGGLEPSSSGTYISPDGSIKSLDRNGWNLEVLDTWSSPSSGIEYPAGWKISIPSLDLELTGRPLMANQELNVSTIYWEGATSFNGVVNGQAVTGQGYVELTGYGDSMSGRL